MVVPILKCESTNSRKNYPNDNQKHANQETLFIDLMGGSGIVFYLPDYPKIYPYQGNSDRDANDWAQKSQAKDQKWQKQIAKCQMDQGVNFYIHFFVDIPLE